MRHRDILAVSRIQAVGATEDQKTRSILSRRARWQREAQGRPAWASGRVWQRHRAVIAGHQVGCTRHPDSQVFSPIYPKPARLPIYGSEWERQLLTLAPGSVP